VTAPPPALARPAAGVSGGEGCWCVAAGVGIAGGRSTCWGGGGHGRRPPVTAAPLALARPAAGVSGGEGCLCVAAGVGMAGGGSAFTGGGAGKGNVHV